MILIMFRINIELLFTHEEKEKQKLKRLNLIDYYKSDSVDQNNLRVLFIFSRHVRDQKNRSFGIAVCA